MNRATDRRKRDLAAIHVVASQLRLDDDTYRDLLERVSGKRSAAQLDTRGRAAVLDELRRLAGDGARRARNTVPPPGEPPHVRSELRAMVTKVGCMLAERGLPWNYARSLAQRMFRVERVEWLSAEQMHRLVAALSCDQRRRRKRTAKNAS